MEEKKALNNEELKNTGFLQFESLMEDGGKCVLFIDNSGSHQIPYFIRFCIMQ